MEDLLQKIILKAYEVNKNTKHTVFVNFYGHINGVEVQIQINGWKENKTPNEGILIRLDKENATEKMKEILKRLEELEEE